MIEEGRGVSNKNVDARKLFFLRRLKTYQNRLGFNIHYDKFDVNGLEKLITDDWISNFFPPFVNDRFFSLYGKMLLKARFDKLKEKAQKDGPDRNGYKYRLLLIEQHRSFWKYDKKAGYFVFNDRYDYEGDFVIIRKELDNQIKNQFVQRAKSYIDEKGKESRAIFILFFQLYDLSKHNFDQVVFFVCTFVFCFYYANSEFNLMRRCWFFFKTLFFGFNVFKPLTPSEQLYFYFIEYKQYNHVLNILFYFILYLEPLLYSFVLISLFFYYLGKIFKI